MLIPEHLQVLAIRSNEVPHYYPERPTTPTDDGRLYAVALIQTPTFPGERRAHNRHLAVVAIRYTASGWQWVNLEPATKQFIGGHLRQRKAFINRWYFMQLKQQEQPE